MSTQFTPGAVPRPEGNGKLTRFTHGVTCPVCGGQENDPRGESTRCFGFIDGDWVHCTREDYSTGCPHHPTSESYSHRLYGACKCGVEHNPAQSSNGHLGEIDCVYPYHDATGKVIFEVVRFKNPKSFRQRQPGQTHGWSVKGIEPVLYRLPELLATPIETPVWICEGEKDVDALHALGLTATTNPCGALKWRPAYSDTLKGRICRIIPDNDEKGRSHARQVSQSLAGKAMSVKVVDLPYLPDKGDVSDWIANGGTAKKLEWLAETEPAQLINDSPIVNRDGKWVPCLRNSEIWISKQDWIHSVRYDTFRQAIQVQDQLISDEMIISLTSQIETEIRTAWHQNHIQSALVNIAYRNKFSSLTEWFLSLPKWDGIYRLNTFFCDAYGVPYTLYVGECARVLFLSAVARAFNPGCQADVMVVLIGPQGLGKSMGISHLCPNPAWYADDLGCDIFEGKAGEGLQGKWLFEFSEFARVNRATLDAVKSFVSRRVDHYRPPYGRIARDFPRSCIFIGTTNDQHPLRDVENRRFMPIYCTQADLTWIDANRDQLWAEALLRHEQGEPHWVSDPTLKADCTKIQESARMDDAWETILEEQLNGRETTTMTEAADKLGIKPDRLDKSTQTRIGFVLNSMGFKRRRVREEGERCYMYERNLSPRKPEI